MWRADRGFVSPGLRELRWLNPVYPRDTITFATEIVKLRPAASRLEWGIMTGSNASANQRGAVLSFISLAFVDRKLVGVDLKFLQQKFLQHLQLGHIKNFENGALGQAKRS